MKSPKALVSLAAMLVLSLFLPTFARASEKQIGNACSGDQNAADWDTIAQCSSGTFVRANPFLSTTMAVGSTSVTTNATLDVNGAILSRSYNAGSSTTINWSQGNEQYTTASCGAFSFSGMTDGGTYELLVEGTTSGTCSFSNTDSPTLTFKMPSNNGASTSGTMTLYHFVRMGSYVIVTWMPGF